MDYDPGWCGRRAPRLQGYDYAQQGAYFVTPCTQQRACLFGNVADGEMRLNDAGRMIAMWWEKLPEKYPHADLDAWVIMPNHLHGIIVIMDDEPQIALDRVGSRDAVVQNHDDQRLHSRRQGAGMATLSRQTVAAQLSR